MAAQVNPAAGGLYADFPGFSRLRAGAREGDAATRAEVATQMEALFVGAMLRSMRQAGEVLASGSGGGLARDLHDDQLALALARDGRLGFARAVLRELAPAAPDPSAPAAQHSPAPAVREPSAPAAQGASAPAAQEPSAPAAQEPSAPAAQEPSAPAAQEPSAPAAQEPSAPAARGLSAHPARGFAAPARNASLVARDWAALRASAARPAAGEQPLQDARRVAAPPPETGGTRGFDSPEAFAHALWPAASRAAHALGTRPEAVLAVAALESGWGRHVPARADGSSSHNLFGIKAHGWGGEVTHAATLEFEHGAFARRVEPFRAYDSPQAAVEDFARFVRANPRYREALASDGDAAAFVHALARAGYATDPRYGEKLETLLDSAPLRAAAAQRGA